MLRRRERDESGLLIVGGVEKKWAKAYTKFSVLGRRIQPFPGGW